MKWNTWKWEDLTCCVYCCFVISRDKQDSGTLNAHCRKMEPEEQLCRAEMEIKIHVRGVLHSLLNFLSTTQWFCNQEKGEGIFLQGNLFASFHPRHQRSRWWKEDKGSAMDCLLSYLSKVHFSRKYLSQEIHSVRWELVTWVLLKNATPWLCWRALGQSSVQMWVPNKWKWTLRCTAWRQTRTGYTRKGGGL